MYFALFFCKQSSQVMFPSAETEIQNQGCMDCHDFVKLGDKKNKDSDLEGRTTSVSQTEEAPRCMRRRKKEGRKRYCME